MSSAERLNVTTAIVALAGSNGAAEGASPGASPEAGRGEVGSIMTRRFYPGGSDATVPPVPLGACDGAPALPSGGRVGAAAPSRSRHPRDCPARTAHTTSSSHPTPNSVTDSNALVTARAISTMIAASGVNDVMRIWNNARRDGIEYNLAFIGSDFTMEYTTPFNQAYMRALYQYGFDKARMGYPWSHQPPF